MKRFFCLLMGLFVCSKIEAEGRSLLSSETVYVNFLRERPRKAAVVQNKSVLENPSQEEKVVSCDNTSVPSFCCSELPSLFSYVSYHFGDSLFLGENYFSTGLYYIPNLSLKKAGLYLEASGYFAKGGDTIQTTGIGVRYRDPYCNWIWGATLFGDTRFTDITTLFQIGLSFELYSPFFDFYLNSYFPTGTQRHYSNLYQYTYDGPYFASAIGEQYLLKGVDYLMGRYLPMSYSFSLFGALGGYYFSDGRGLDYNGFQMRVDLWYKSIVSIGFLLTTDRVNGSLAEGRVGITIPLETLFCYKSICKFFQQSSCLGCYANGYNGKQAPLPRLAPGGIVGCCCRYSTEGF